MELLMTIRQRVADAIHDRICGWCSKTITPFRDHLSKVEFQISHFVRIAKIKLWRFR